MGTEQRLRAAFFYTSVAVFFVGLPFILSLALGFSFDRRTFTFTRTGLIAIKTQPAGASVLLNNKLLNDKTPTTINELLPGAYAVEITLEGFYPYFSEVKVDAGAVTHLEKVILFPLRSDIKKMNKEIVSSFWYDQEKSMMYYYSEADGCMYRSEAAGEHFKRIASIPPVLGEGCRWKVSPDREKVLFFNRRTLQVVAFEGKLSTAEQPPRAVVLEYPEHTINDVFWHSDSYHLVVVTDSKIEVIEAQSEYNPVKLVQLNKRTASVSYDAHGDTLYFIDSQRASDGKLYDNVYTLQLSTAFFELKDILHLVPTEE